MKRNILLFCGVRCCLNYIYEGRIDVGYFDSYIYGFIGMDINGILDFIIKLKDIFVFVLS